MNKRKAIVKFIVICTVVVIGLLACIVNFRVPFTTQRYVGFLGAIESKMGIDLRGGVLAVFEAEGNPSSSDMNATVKRLERMLSDRGHFDTTVVAQGNRHIRIEMPGTDDTQAVFDAIGTPAKLEMRIEGEDEPFLWGEHIRRVDYYQDPQTFEHGVKITFTTTGGDLFRQVVRNATIDVTKIEILLNGKVEISPTIGSSDAGRDNTTVITGGYTRERAMAMKTEIESGLFEVTLKPAEVSRILATLGAGAMTAGIVACIVGLLFIFIVMYLLYGDLGLLSNLSLLVFVVLFLFFLAVIDTIQLTLPGIAGIILSIGMAVDANILIFERIKDEYRSGKRMAVAVESGFNKTIKTIIDANVTTIIAAVVLYFFGTGPIQGFAITLFLGVAISMFCSLLVTRSFAKTYLHINGNNAKRLRLNKLVVTEKTETPIDEVSQDTKPRRRSLNFGGEK
jgi:preprotein translocase subunit SecD